MENEGKIRKNEGKSMKIKEKWREIIGKRREINKNEGKWMEIKEEER